MTDLDTAQNTNTSGPAVCRRTRGMSPLGHKRTFSEAYGMFRFDPESVHWNTAAKCPLKAVMRSVKDG
jgi:hypothetical protein